MTATSGEPGDIRLLLVEDNPGDAKLVAYALAGAGQNFHLTHAKTLAEARDALQHQDFDVIMLDLTLPDSRGLDTVSMVLDVANVIPVIVMSGMQDRAMALEAVRLGAQDYLTKGEADGATMERAIHHAIERKRAEHALAASETRYRSIAENQQDALLLLDGQGRITYANPAALELVGLPTFEIVGRSFDEILVVDEPRSSAGNEDHLSKMLHSMVGALQATTLRTKSGDAVPVETTVAHWREGDADSFMVVMRDVRERHDAEKALAEQRRMLARAQELAHVGSWTMEGAHGDLHGTREFNHILGLDTATTSIPLTRFLDMMQAEAANELVHGLERLAKAGERVDLELTITWRDGTRRVLRVRAERAPRQPTADPEANENGGDQGLVRILGSALDVTEQKEAEQTLAESTRQLAQSEKLAALGTLIAGVAHEINNPLAFVKSNERLIGILLDRILQGFEDSTGHLELNDQQQAAVDQMHKILATNLQGIDRIEAIVRSLRQVARPSTGERHEHDLCEVVRDTMPVLEPVRREHDVHVEFIEPAGALPVKINATEISQVVLNLVKNAVEASPRRALVKVQLSSTPDGGATFEVLDEGDGIDEADRLQILNPFFTTKANGTGLGLPICAKVAESHGGSLEFANRPDGGARFTLRLPAPADAPDIGEVPIPQQTSVDARVLRGGLSG